MNALIKENRNEGLPQLYEEFSVKEGQKRQSYMTCLCGTKNCHDADVPLGSSTYLIRLAKGKGRKGSEEKIIFDVHEDLLAKALRRGTLKALQKNRSRFVTCHHFDSKVLDDDGLPFSYICDKKIALSLYGEHNMRANAVPGKEEAWFVLPTTLSSEQDDTCSRDRTLWDVFKTPFSNKLTESNDNGENTTVVDSRAGSSSLSSIIFNVFKRKHGDDENESISSKRTRRTSFLPTESIIAADSGQIMMSPTITPCSVPAPRVTLATSSSSQTEMPSQEAELTLTSRFDLVGRNPAIDNGASLIENNLSHGNIIVGQRINELAVNILESRKESQEKREGSKSGSVVKLKYKVGGERHGRVYTKCYARIPVSRGEHIDESSKSNTDKLSHRADIVADWIEIMCHSDDEIKGLLEKVVKSKKIGNGTIEWEKEGPFLDVEDCIAIRDSSGVTSTRHICKVFDGIRKLKGMKSGQFHPSQLAAKIGAFETENLLQTLFYLVDAEVDEKKSKSCVFYYTPQIPLLLEMLTASSINDGSYLKSEDISFYKNTEIFFRGTDRGGGNTIDMVRLGNRNNGNCGKYCVPVSVLEGGGETYKNLKETCYNTERSMTFNMLDDESVYIFSIGSSSSDEGIVTGNTRSIMVAFSYTDSQGKAVSARDLDLTISVNVISVENDLDLSDEEATRDFNSAAIDGDRIDRIAPCVIQLTAACMQNNTGQNGNGKVLCLKVKLCKRKMPCGDGFELVGVHFYLQSDELVYSFKFASTAIISNRSTIKAICKKAILIYSNDGKMNNCLVGLGTCACKYSCPNCIRPTSSKEYPTFVKDIAMNKMSDWDETKWGRNPLLDAEYKDYPRRKDRYHIHKSWNNFHESMGRYSEFSDAVTKSTMAKASAEISHSIEAEPLLGETKNMNHIPADPLHNTEGTVNHLNKAAIKLIKAIATDDDGSWAKRTIDIDEIKPRVKELISSIKNDDEYKKGIRELRKQRKEYFLSHKDLSVEYEKTGQQRDENLIIELENRKEAHSKSLEDINIRTGVGLNNRIIKGLKEFLNLIADKKGDISIDKLDEGEYIFTQCIRTFAGDFAKQHGGLDLTARRSMKSLESREKIHKIASRAYKDNLHRQEKMIEILDWWRECAYHLLEVCKLTNSQEKMTKERLDRLKIHTVWFLAHWRRKAPKENDLYWKLHALLCSLFDFCELTGMCGLAAAQGFENNHFEMNKLAEMLSRIAQNGRRVSKLQNRQQTFLMSGVNQRIRAIDDSKKKFGARRKRGQESVGTKALENIEDLLDTGDDFYSCEEFPDGLLIVEQGGLLQMEFAEIYMYLKKKRVPESFLVALEDETELGSKAVQDFKFNSK